MSEAEVRTRFTAGPAHVLRPDESVPTELSEAKLREDMLELLSELPPQFAYAYAKTGLLLLLEEQVEHYPPDAVAEWEIDEYFRLEDEEPFATPRQLIPIFIK